MKSSEQWAEKLTGCLRNPSIIFSEDLSWSALRTVDLHVHNFYQIDYFYEGRGSVVINRKKYWVKPGDLFIANPDDRHGFQADRERPMEGISFKFTLGVKNRSLRFPNYVANLAQLPGMQYRELESYLRRACAEANSFQHGHFEVAAALISAFFVLLTRYLKTGTDLPEGKSDRKTCAFLLDYIRLHCDAPIQLEDLGKLVGLHPRYLCQKFSKEIGRSPMAALTEARMERARQLLTRTRLPISEVGAQAGYRDVYHFSKRFKNVVGMSPRKFREWQAR
jgi:AraC-like DNA-binding protein